jgi:hypothetical protein
VTLRDLIVLYGAAGAVFGFLVYRRSKPGVAALANAALAVPLWPLWAPFALASDRGSAGGPNATRTRREAERRIEHALGDATAGIAGTPLEALLSPRAAAQILVGVEQIAARLDQLEALLGGDELDAALLARRVEELERTGPNDSRALTAARLRHDGALRLSALRDADVQALDELAELADALKTQVLLARYAGASADAASGIVAELSIRLEALGASAQEIVPYVVSEKAES